jgi:hypothetical protein
VTRHNLTPKADPYSMALAKRDRANGAIARLTLEIAAAKAAGDRAQAGRLKFQKAFVYRPMLAEALAQIDAARPRLAA